MQVLSLSDTDVGELLSPRELVTAIEGAVREFEEGRANVPPRLHLEWDANTLLTMPAAEGKGVGVKLVSVVPGNASRGLPVTSGLMILSDRQTGLPVAIMNAAALTAMRTGAVGALGILYMTPPDLETVGIIGVGVQGTWQAIFTCCVRPIREVLYVSRSADRSERFRAAIQEHVPGVRVTQCANATELIAHTNLIVTATTSVVPVLPDEAGLLAGKHFISVGSFRPTMQELPDSVYRLARELAVDSESARHEVGDVIGPVRRGVLNETDVFFIGQLITGRRKVDKRRTTAYKSVGMALYDLTAAQVVYAAAKLRGFGQQIEL
jgi:ornithine cyclodeaminase/alanine dehydrogenase-like protein (mu-crystallin family)